MVLGVISAILRLHKDGDQYYITCRQYLHKERAGNTQKCGYRLFLFYLYTGMSRGFCHSVCLPGNHILPAPFIFSPVQYFIRRFHKSGILLLCRFSCVEVRSGCIAGLSIPCQPR